MSERHMATVTGQTMKVPNNVIIVLIVSLIGFCLIVYIYYQLLVELKAITRSASLINHVACIATNPHCERHLKSRWCNHNSFTQLKFLEDHNSSQVPRGDNSHAKETHMQQCTNQFDGTEHIMLFEYLKLHCDPSAHIVLLPGRTKFAFSFTVIGYSHINTDFKCLP